MQERNMQEKPEWDKASSSTSVNGRRRAVASTAGWRGVGGGPVPEFQGWKTTARVPGRVLPLPAEIPFGKSKGVRVQTVINERVSGCGAVLQTSSRPPGKSWQELPGIGAGEKKKRVPRGRADGWVQPQTASNPFSSGRAARCLGDSGGIPAP